ncbi:hypothetical protein ILUMI_00051 [Ignelater luminosus]|uniref:Uncharacterized protein n=1 Tax=Ignelater luminosus TaxID=2038154 RepID=A0A8K0DMD0_IGNLU|nr:hypothetical protein ILUMI_00051 [Ignelater luminosus]
MKAVETILASYVLRESTKVLAQPRQLYLRPKGLVNPSGDMWFGSACISLPPLLILGNEHRITEDDKVNEEVCIVCQSFGYQLYATLCSFYIPLTVMMVVYYKIFRAARRIVLDEKRAQSHLEAHCYLEISVKNGGGPPENRISSHSPSPANPSRTNHRSSSASSNTMNSGKEETRRFTQQRILKFEILLFPERYHHAEV